MARAYLPFKRAIDVIVAGVALMVTLPLWAVISAAIVIDTGGPVFYRQRRIGLHGSEFVMLKFRSMHPDSEEKGVYERAHDPRVTRVGRLLRASSLDELPQVLNVLFGSMSIIGPRPPLLYHPWPIEDYSDRQRTRFDVRPGITGWAQVQGRKLVPWGERIQIDVDYVNRCSLLLDMEIAVRTVRMVLSAEANLNAEPTAPSRKR